MKKTILLFVVAFCMNALFSQNLKVSGIVYDEQLECLQSAEVGVLKADSAAIAYAVTDVDGSFAFNLPVDPTRDYFLYVSHVSYESQTIKINDTVMNVYMSVASRMLEGVEVVASKPLFESVDGKTIVNVGQIANVEAMNSAKMLSRLPGVTASYRDGVTLNGQSAKIYINGVEQRVSGDMAVSLLESMPASMLEQVELVSINDGTRSALGNGVVINLKMKKMAYDGYVARIGGMATLQERPNNDLGGGGQAFAIVKKGRTIFNASLSYKNNLNWSEWTESSYYSDSSSLHAKSSNDNRIHILTGLANLNYSFKNDHNINFNFFFYDDYDKGSEQQTIGKAIDDSDINYKARYSESGNDDLWSGNIEYTTPDTLKDSFKASYGLMYGGLRSKYDYYKADSIGYGETGEEKWYLKHHPVMTGFQHDMKFDYKHIFGDESTLKLGAMASLGYMKDNVDFDEPEFTGKYLSTEFKGQEQDIESYVSYRKSIKKHFQLAITLRYVHMHQYFDYITYQQSLSKNYDYLFPFAQILFRDGLTYECALAWVNSMTKPSYEVMLPGLRYEDDYTVNVGNPNVKPMTNYGIVFNQMLLKALFLSLRCERLTDISGYILNNRESTAELKVYEYKNYADANRFYANLSTPFAFFKEKLTGNVNIDVRYYDMINFKNGYEPKEGNGSSYWQWSLKGSVNYAIIDALNVYVWSMYKPKLEQPHQTTDAVWTMDAGASYQWGKDGKFMAMFDVEDLFDTYKTHRTTYYDGYFGDIKTPYGSRLVKLTFAVKFNGGEKVDNRAVDYNKNDTDRFETQDK